MRLPCVRRRGFFAARSPRLRLERGDALLLGRLERRLASRPPPSARARLRLGGGACCFSASEDRAFASASRSSGDLTAGALAATRACAASRFDAISTALPAAWKRAPSCGVRVAA